LQEGQLEEYAKAVGLWLNDKSGDGTLGAYLRSAYRESRLFGSESQLYNDESRPALVMKETDLSHYNGNPRMMLDKYAVFNALFPATAYELVGFGRDGFGHFRMVTRQPYVANSSPAGKEEIDAYMRARGFTRDGGWWYASDRTIRLTDLGPNNVIKSEDGVIQVIDADIELADKRGGVERVA